MTAQAERMKPCPECREPVWYRAGDLLMAVNGELRLICQRCGTHFEVRG